MGVGDSFLAGQEQRYIFAPNFRRDEDADSSRERLTAGIEVGTTVTPELLSHPCDHP